MRDAAPNCRFIEATQENIPQRILDAEVFVGHAKVPVPWDQVVKQGKLQFIQSSAAGLDHCLAPAQAQRIIHAHGGRVRVTTADEQGVTIAVELPEEAA